MYVDIYIDMYSTYFCTKIKKPQPTTNPNWPTFYSRRFKEFFIYTYE